MLRSTGRMAGGDTCGSLHVGAVPLGDVVRDVPRLMERMEIARKSGEPFHLSGGIGFPTQTPQVKKG